MGNLDMDARSVRLDVYVKDEKEVVYDIEMQVSHTKELPKRSRYLSEYDRPAAY